MSGFTRKEKIRLMTPQSSFLRLIWEAVILKHYNKTPVLAGGCKRKNVPLIKFCDGPRGLVSGYGTCFPVPVARAASFDIDLEEKIGLAIGREVRAAGGNYFGGVCVNLARHPAWGRSQEAYGEDSFVLGAFGAALVRGVQTHNVVACVKHYALNSMENARFKVDITCTERTLREVYLPHFKECIDAGVGSVMGAYNLFRGEHCCHSGYLLRTILKDEWGFGGFTLSDFVWGVRDTEKAANAGLDVEMPFPRFYGRKLKKAVRKGTVDESTIDDAAGRIARTMVRFAEAPDPEGSYRKELIACDSHVALADEAAERAMTLIKNEQSVLPFDRGKVKTVALFGRLAVEPNLGDYGSSRVRPPYVISALDGLENLLDPEVEVLYAWEEDLEACRRIAARSDAVIVVAGYDHMDEGEFIRDKNGEGEGGDRTSLSLHQDEIELILAVAGENPLTAVVLIGGSTIMMEEWRKAVPAILMAYYPGMMGGNVIARTLFGENNPGGKLPFVIPSDYHDLPDFDRDADAVEYGYYHGYTKLDKEGVAPAYYFGHGLSYTSFSIENHSFSVLDTEVVAACTVINTGTRSGDQVVQFYVGFSASSVDRPVKLLRGFARVGLAPGESKALEIRCPVNKLRWYNPDSGRWELEHMVYEAHIGTSSNPADLLDGEFAL